MRLSRALPFDRAPCYRAQMLKTRLKRMTEEGARAVTCLGTIHASIAALNDEDLLDLADIFPSGARTPLGDAAAAEMQRRNLKL